MDPQLEGGPYRLGRDRVDRDELDVEIQEPVEEIADPGLVGHDTDQMGMAIGAVAGVKAIGLRQERRAQFAADHYLESLG